MNVQNATTKDLVEFFNANCEQFDVKPVKRFADRAAAEKRVQRLLDFIAEDATKDAITEVVPGFSNCPHCEIHLSGGYRDGVTKQYTCLTCDHEFGESTRTHVNNHAQRAAAIAKTWKDPSVAAARARRHGVRLVKDGKVGDFRSVRAAFIAMGLPLNKHIQFRMELKAAGKIENAYGYDWSVTEL